MTGASPADRLALASRPGRDGQPALAERDAALDGTHPGPDWHGNPI